MTLFDARHPGPARLGSPGRLLRQPLFSLVSRTAAVLAIVLALSITAGVAVAQDSPVEPPAQPSTVPVDTTGEEKPVAPPEIPAAFKSPAATLATFIEAMSQEPPDFETGAECLDLGDSGALADAANDLALQLYRCIIRIEVVDFENDGTILDAGINRIGDAVSWRYFPRPSFAWSSADDYGGRLWAARQTRFKLIDDLTEDGTITLVRMTTGVWKFSAETVAGIEAFWSKLDAAEIKPVAGFTGKEFVPISDRIKALWPKSIQERAFFGIKYWQWLSLFAVILLGIVLDFTIRFILAAVSRKAIARRGGTARKSTLRKTVRPFGLTAAALLWMWAIRHLGLTVEAKTVLVPAVKLFAMLAVVWSAYRVTDLLAEVASNRAARTGTKFDDVLIPLVRKALKVFITVFGLIYIADSLSVPIAPLLTGLGIGGAGFAFAAKDSLEHLFGSFTVIADRPFEVGDWVVIGEVEGTVEELGFRSTRVRTFYNSLVTVPNGNLVRATVDNFGRRKYRRWTTHLNLTYDTSPERIEAFCEGVREIIRIHPYTRKDYYQVWLHKFGPHSLDVLLYMFFEAPDWNTELRERHRLMIEIMRLAAQLGVDFAFPTQTLEIAQKPDGSAVEPTETASASVPDADTDRRARIVGKRTVRALTANASWREEKPPPYVFDFAEDVIDDDGDGESQIESKVGGSA